MVLNMEITVEVKIKSRTARKKKKLKKEHRCQFLILLLKKREQPPTKWKQQKQQQIERWEKRANYGNNHKANTSSTCGSLIN